jgi:pimeloyl-ACP methyl ester carboxylesterase
MKLILLPGMDGTGTLYEPFRAALGPSIELQVVRYPVDEVLNYDDLEHIVRGILPTQEPYLLLAESFSGPLGIALAAQRPKGLRGLLLCCTFAKCPVAFGSMLAYLAPYAPIRAMPAAVRHVALLGRFATPELKQQLNEAISMVAPRVFQQRLQAVLRVNVTGQLSQIDVPTVYLQAIHDRMVGAHAARTLRSAMPQMSIVRVDAPHLLLQVRPDDAAAAVHDFIAQVADA